MEAAGLDGRINAAVIAAHTITTRRAPSSRMATPAGGDADETLVEDELPVATDRLSDDQRGEHRRREHVDERPRAPGSGRRPSSTGPDALNRIVTAPTTATMSQIVRRPIRQARLAATIGTRAAPAAGGRA